MCVLHISSNPVRLIPLPGTSIIAFSAFRQGITIPVWYCTGEQKKRKTSRRDLYSTLQLVVLLVVDYLHIQSFVLATEETTVTQWVSPRPIKYQFRSWSQRYEGQRVTSWPQILQILCVSYMSTVPIVGVGEEMQKSRPWNLKRQHPLLELPYGLLALCRRTLGSGRHRYALAPPDKLLIGTKGPIRRRLTVYMDAVEESGRNSVSKHRFRLSLENERADARRDRPNRTRETKFLGVTWY